MSGAAATPSNPRGSAAGPYSHAAVRVLCADTDRMGVVYYGQYLRMFEFGRVELLRKRGLRFPDIEHEFSIGLPVFEAFARYVRPGREDDELHIGARLGQVTAASLRFDYQIVRRDLLLVEGYTVHACVNLRGKAQRFPAPLLERLRRITESVL